MHGKILATLSLFIVLILIPFSGALADEMESGHILSANIPLDSYIYTTLDKLAGLGLLDELSTGSRPFSRIRAARWIRIIAARAEADSDLPSYAAEMIDRLKLEFAYELSLLAGEKEGFHVSPIAMVWTNAGYNGEPLIQHETLSTYEPLYINQNGYELSDGFNSSFEGRIEASIGNGWVLSATPHAIWNDGDFSTDLESAYIKTHIGNLEIQAGKDAFWWGQGQRGSLLLTPNSAAKTGIKLSTLDPVKLDGILSFLGSANATFFYSRLDEDRGDVRDPAFTGFRADFTPSPNFTFAAAIASILGGEGHELNWSDVWDLITGNNALTSGSDKWDAIAGWDFRWRIPDLNGLEIYGEFYGEDQAFKIIPMPTKNTPLFGIYIPKLTANGDWDLTLETAKTTKVWYRHSLYTEGYTDGGQIIGDAMGNHAKRFYVKLTHYLPTGAILAFHGEYTAMDLDAVNPEQITSFWASYRTIFESGWTLDASLGMARIENVNFTAGLTDQVYLMSLGLGKGF